MRLAGKMAAECLDDMIKLVVPGATPLQVDRACHDWTLARGAIPATLNYHGFPASLCISVNDVVCHGIPDNRPFQDGDIVNLDVTPKLNGYHGDTNGTVMVGNVDPKVRKLVQVTYQSLWAAIREVKPGNTIGDLGHAILQVIKPYGYSIVLDYCGHGIGSEFHEEPSVPHLGRPGDGMKLRAGMTFTIEPMINLGQRFCRVEKDGWTVRTKDGSLSAQFEHTVLVTDTGVEVLTLRPGEPFQNL